MNSELPFGWRWLSPDELAADIPHSLGIGPFGSDLKVSDYTRVGVPLVFVRNIRSERFDPAGQPHVSVAKAGALRAHAVVPGDVLITKMGDPPGDAAVYPHGAPEARMTADCIRLRVRRNVASPRFIAYATRAGLVRRQILQETRGVAQKKISLERFRTVRYPVPPLTEQDRIVAALETQFSRLDAAVASLTRAKANVKRARSSVLAAAIEGRLLPRGGAWTETSTGELFDFVTSGSRGWATYYADEGAPFIRIGDLNRGTLRVDWRSAQRVKVPDTAEGKRTRVKPGDILISITADIGIVGLVSEDVPEAYVNQHVAIARLRDPRHARFVAWFLDSESGGQRQFRDLKRGATKAGLGLDDIRAIQIPLPPLEEQHRIVAEVDRRLSVLDALDKTIDANLARCARLRQAILKRAFEGKLVPAAAEPSPTEAAG